MKDNFFLDTNILVYSFDQSQPQKQSISKKLINEALTQKTGNISYQVIQEFLNIASRKFVTPLSLEDCEIYLSNVLEPLCSVFSSPELFHHALEISSRWKFSFYDSLIVAAALSLNCKILYTEDLQHNQKIENMIIVNPFLNL